jgi:hypothetical protein
MNHLPTNRGFDSFTGYLGGAQNYYSSDRWQDAAPLVNVSTYSSTLYGSMAVDVVANHPPGPSLFMYLAWQAVHSPYACGPDADLSGAIPDCKTTAFQPAYPGVYVNMLAGTVRHTLYCTHCSEHTCRGRSVDGQAGGHAQGTRHVGGGCFDLGCTTELEVHDTD